MVHEVHGELVLREAIQRANPGTRDRRPGGLVWQGEVAERVLQDETCQVPSNMFTSTWRFMDWCQTVEILTCLRNPKTTLGLPKVEVQGQRWVVW